MQQLGNENKPYFKFEVTWHGDDDLLEWVKGWWGSFSVRGNPIFLLANIEVLKISLKERSSNSFVNLERTKFAVNALKN